MRAYIILILFSFTLPIKAQKKLLLAGSGNNQIMIIDKKSGNIEWSHNIGDYKQGIECNSICMTDEKTILYSYKKGVKLIDLNHNTIWDYHSPQNSEIHSASILPDGNFLLAINGTPTRIIEITPSGQTKDSININVDLGNNNPHMQCRQIRKAKNGNYLVPVLGKSILYEINSDGNIIQTYDIKGGAFSVFEMNNGNLLLPLGDAHCIQQIHRKSGKEIRHLSQNDLHPYKILFAGELRKLKNGHWMMANWSGHSSTPNAPQIIEFDLNGKVYWTLENQKYGNISTFFPIYNNILK